MDETIDLRGGIPPDDPQGSGAQLSESDWEAIDTAVIRLEDAWQKGQPPDIGSLVSSDARPALQRHVLVQLIAIDLEWRWRTAGSATGGVEGDDGAAAGEDQTVGHEQSPVALLPRWPRLADYAARYPQLGPVEQIPIDLVVGEYYARCRYGNQPAHDEYLSQFGPLHPELAQRLQAVDDEVASAPARPADPPDDLPSPGAKVEYFGDYVLLERLGKGGMGVVYKARQLSLKRLVAVKMVLAGQLADQEDVGRFHVEAEAAANLDHPGIVRIFEIGQHQGRHYFSMDLVDGESLEARLKKSPLPPREAAHLIEQVARAIAYAHSHGVIHRDLKPSNILVDCENQPRVTDFGLAKRMHGDSNLTAAGVLLGTPSYMPPEQAESRLGQITERSDVYSLGATLYALLVGHPPFQAATPLETLVQVCGQEPVSLRQLNPAIPRDLEMICVKCLEKDPRRRYGSADELAAELKRFLEGRPIEARPVGHAERLWRWCKREPVVASLTAAAVLLLALVASVAVIGYVSTSRAFTEASRRAADAERESRHANSLRLAGEAREVFRRNPSKGVSLALQASLISLNQGEVPPPQTIKTLRELLDSANDRRVRGLLAATPLPGNPDAPGAWISPDGHWLVTLAANDTLLRWDLAAGDPGRTAVFLSQDIGTLDTALITSNSRWFAAVTSNGARLWDLTALDPTEASGALLDAHGVSCGPHSADLTASRDGRWLAVSTCGCTELCDLNAPEPWSEPIELARGGSNVKISDDSRWAVTRNMDDDRVWDLAAKDLRVGFRSVRGKGERVTCEAFTRDGGRLFVVKSDGTTAWWDLTAKEIESKPTGFGTASDWQEVVDVLFNPAGTLLVAVSQNKIRVWDCEKRTACDDAEFRIAPLMAGAGLSIAPASLVRRVTQSSDDGRWLLVHDKNSACLYDLAKHASDCKRQITDNPPREIVSAWFSPDGKWLLLATSDCVSLWDLRSANLAKRTFPSSICKSVPASPTLSSDGRWLATMSDDKAVRVWDLTSGAAGSKVIMQHPTNVKLVFFAGERLVTWDDWVGRLWDLSTPDGIAKPPRQLTAICGARLPAVAVGQDGQWLIQAEDNGSVLLWNLSVSGDPCVAKRLQANTDKASLVTITPDSRWVITAGEDGKARLWSLTAADPAAAGSTVLSSHDGRIIDMMVSPDSRWLITGGFDRRVLVSEITAERRARKPLILDGHEAGVHHVVISPDSHWLLTESIDGVALLWELACFGQRPPCYRWNGGTASSIVKKSGSKWRIASTDQISSLWNERLRRFEEAEAAADSPSRSATAPMSFRSPSVPTSTPRLGPSREIPLTYVNPRAVMPAPGSSQSTFQPRYSPPTDAPSPASTPTGTHTPAPAPIGIYSPVPASTGTHTPAPAPIGIHDHEVARKILSIGGSIEIELDDGTRQSVGSMPLPDKPFSVTAVWLRGKGDVADADLAGLAGLGKLRHVDLVGSKASDETLKVLAGLPNLEEVWLFGDLYTDLGMKYLGRLKHARELIMECPRLTDAALECLSGLESLESLNVGYAQIKGPGLARLVRMTRLRSLQIYRTQIDDDALVTLPSLPALRYLAFGYTRVTDAGLKELRRFSQLQELYMEEIQLSGLGLAHLVAMKDLKRMDLHGIQRLNNRGLANLPVLPCLEYLNLDNTGIGNVGLEHLRDLARLRELHVEKTNVTAQGLLRLHQALPDCRLTADGAVFKEYRALLEKGMRAPERQRSPFGLAAVALAKPLRLDLAPDAKAWDLKTGSPLNPASLVLKPAAIKGLMSWTLETCASRGAPSSSYRWSGGAGQLSPDGRLYATGGHDGVIRFLDPATGKLRIALVNPEPLLTALTWSPDNVYVAVGCMKGVVRIWNVVKGILVVAPTAYSTHEISSLAWSPDGTLLAIGRNGESAVTLWDVREARQSATLQEKADANRSVNFLAWSADGKQLMATTDLAIRIWDVARGRLVRTLDSQSPQDQAGRLAAAWSPDGKRIATLCDNEKVKFFDSTYEPVASGGVGSQAYSQPFVAWSPDGCCLAATNFNDCHVLDTENASREFGIPRGLAWGDGISGLSWSKDSSKLFCTHRWSGSVTAIDAYSGEPLWQLAGRLTYDGYDTDICASPDGRQYATAVCMDRLYTWDAMRGTPVHDYGLIFPNHNQVAWSNDGRLAVAGGRGGGWDGTGARYDPGGRIWDLRESGQSHLYHDGGSRCAAWSPDGKTLARGGRDVVLWTSGTGDPHQLFHTDTDVEIAKLAWGVNNSTLAAGLTNNKVVILEMPSGKVLRTLTREGLEGGIRYLAVLPDGRLVAASYNGAVSVWNSRWETVGDLARMEINVHDGTMTAGRTTIAFAASDGIMLWDADKLAVQKKVGTGPMYSVAWSVPFRQLIAAQGDRLVFYDEPTGELLASQVIWWGPGKHLFLSPEGHMRVSPAMSEDVVYVALTDDGRQITLRPNEFAAKYGWRNDTEKIRLSFATAKSVPIVVRAVVSDAAIAQPRPKSVRIIYLVSADRTARADFTKATEAAAKDLQAWYAKQLGGPTFRLNQPAVEIAKSDKEAKWFYSHPNGDNKDGWGFNNGLAEAQRLVGAKPGGPEYVWVIYSDGPGKNGRGGGGVAVLPEDDLLGLVGQHPQQKDVKRWIAGLGHELGHAFGLAHPRDSKKDADALMGMGIYGKYPDHAYLTEEDKKILMKSPFFFYPNGEPVVKPLEVVEKYAYEGGSFAKRSRNGRSEWVETRVSGPELRFVETGRGKDWITLFDSSRKMFLRLPVDGGNGSWSTNDGKTWNMWIRVDRAK